MVIYVILNHSVCTSSFSAAVIKYNDPKELKEERVYVALCFQKVRVSAGGEIMVGAGTYGHISLYICKAQ